MPTARKTQSIIVDEADTYLHWVAAGQVSHWEPHSYNHVLNSVLMRFSIWCFGLSHLSTRAPAVLGGLLYITASWSLARWLFTGHLRRCVWFGSAVFNPFVMDCLGAARGYGLALGFLAIAISLFASQLTAGRAGEKQMIRTAISMSALCAATIAANFTFTFASLLLCCSSLAASGVIHRPHPQLSMKLVAADVLPGLAILLVCPGSALVDFPRDQLFWGSESLLQSWRDIRDASFHQLNPYLVNPLLAKVLEAIRPRLFQSLAIFGALYFVLLGNGLWRRERWCLSPRVIFAAALTTILTLTVILCWLQFQLLGIPFPLERTSIFVVPLAMGLFGAALGSIPATGGPSDRFSTKALGWLGTAILTFGALYFTGELRDSYFRLWRDGAEVQPAFRAVTELSQQIRIREIAVDPVLASSFKFYAARDGVSTLHFESFEPMPEGRDMYIVIERRFPEFARRPGLRVLWRGAESGLLVMVRAEGQ